MSWGLVSRAATPGRSGSAPPPLDPPARKEKAANSGGEHTPRQHPRLRAQKAARCTLHVYVCGMAFGVRLCCCIRGTRLREQTKQPQNTRSYQVCRDFILGVGESGVGAVVEQGSDHVGMVTLARPVQGGPPVHGVLRVEIDAAFRQYPDLESRVARVSVCVGVDVRSEGRGVTPRSQHALY